MAETSKPFIGYKSAGRRPERNNDREGAKGAPLAAIRGWIAGTAGLPGDIEGLVRMIPGIDRKEPILPTSDFYKEWLPLRGESAVERAFTEAGSLAGGVGVGSAARGVERGVSAGARGALSAVEAAARNAQVPVRLNPQAGVIKMKGGNWLDGSVEEALRPLQVRVRTEGINGHTAENALSDQALNQWLDKKLARYVKNEMATPEDPVRALAERGVLHVPPEQLNFRPEMHGRYLDLGQTADAKSPAAKVWEGASDNTVGYGPAKRWLGEVDDWVQDTGPTEEVASNSWLAKVPPDTRVHYLSEPRNFSDDLGFPHLIDELRNATNPESGLPRELLLKYDALDRVTVPQAVERVSKINEWRAAQKAEADLARANNAATVLHKEYPEGYRWVELKAPDRFENPAQQEEFGDLGRYARKKLSDALKYEGDTMGHCVGGYCDDVASGKSRIYSLRDKKGQPHTTIEIAPGRREGERAVDYRQLLPENYAAKYGDDSDLLDRIAQIKGKQNKAPNSEYLPYVQDFVRSGKWSDVGDLSNSGLVDLQGMHDVPEHLKSGSRFLTQSEYDDAVREFVKQRDGVEPGFSHGGAVNVDDYDPNRVDALVQALEASFE